MSIIHVYAAEANSVQNSRLLVLNEYHGLGQQSDSRKLTPGYGMRCAILSEKGEVWSIKEGRGNKGIKRGGESFVFES